MKQLEKILGVLTFSLFVLMIVLVSIQVLNRYFIQMTIPWTEEMTRISYLLMIYIGSVLAVLQNNHVRITILDRRLPPSVRRVVWYVMCAIAAVFFSVVAYGNFIYTKVNWTAKFPATPGLTIGHVMSIVMACSILMALLYFLNIFSAPPDISGSEEDTLL